VEAFPFTDQESDSLKGRRTSRSANIAGGHPMKLIGLGAVLWAVAWQLPFAAADDREDRERAVAAIQKLGGKVEVDDTAPEKPVVKVSFRNTKVTDEGLSHVKGLTGLRELDLSHTDITNDGLHHLRALSDLTTLNLSFSKVTDAGLANLKGLSKLKWLDLEAGCKDVEHYISDAGLEHLKGLKNLEYLNLEWNKVTDAGLAHLKGLSNLQSVNLYAGKVTASGVEELQKALPKAKIKR